MAPGALVSTVVDKNSTVLSLLVTRSIVEAAFIVVGSMLVRAGWRRRDSLGWSRFLPGRGSFLVLLGIFTEAQAVYALANLTLSPGFRGLRDTGIGFALSRLLGLDQTSYQVMMDQWLPVSIPIVLSIVGFLAASLMYRLLHRLRPRASSRSPPHCACIRWPKEWKVGKRPSFFAPRGWIAVKAGFGVRQCPDRRQHEYWKKDIS